MPGCGNRGYYANLRMVTGMSLSPNAQVAVVFTCEDSKQKQTFTLYIILPTGSGMAIEHEGFLKRPRTADEDDEGN